MTRILGIDPGSRITGYGVIDLSGGHLTYVASGCIRTATGAFPVRLKDIYQGVDELISQYLPVVFTIEEVFLAKNPMSALKLGQARGAAIVAGVAHELPVFEYAARRVKQALVGTGRASKAQVNHMVQTLLQLEGAPSPDAADALAVAICHVNTQRDLMRAKT